MAETSLRKRVNWVEGPLTAGIHEVNMSNCMGSNTVSTRVDRAMVEQIEEQANALGVTPAEYLRRVLDFHRMMDNGEANCPGCGQTLDPVLETEASRGVA